MVRRGKVAVRGKAAAALSLACVVCIAGCRTFQYREPYLHMLQTDSTEIAVQRGVVRIGFSFANMTGKPISGDCEPTLERRINDKWKGLPANSLLITCDRATLERGAIFHSEFAMIASNIVEDLALAGVRSAGSLDGVYRLRWRFVEGRDLQSTRAKPVSGISNEFHLLYAPR